MGQIESVLVTAESGSYLYNSEPVITMEGGALAVDYIKGGKHASILFSPSEWKRAEINYKDAV